MLNKMKNQMSETERRVMDYLEKQKIIISSPEIQKNSYKTEKMEKNNKSQNTVSKIQKSAKETQSVQPRFAVKKSVEEKEPNYSSTSKNSDSLKSNNPGTSLSTNPKKFKTGITGFDRLFKEGIPIGNAIIVEGGPGSGKTTFCLQIAMEMCKQGKKALYMSFEEPEHRLRQHMTEYGWDPEKYEKSGNLMIKRFNALDIARSVEALLSEAKKELLIDIHPVLIPKEFAPDIVCVDSLTSISSAFSGESNRFRVYMEQFFRYLESNNISSFLIREVAHPTHMGLTYTEMGEEISFLSDGIVVLYNVLMNNWTRRRAIEVLKMRGEDIDRRVVEVELVNKKGFVVYPEKTLDETHAKLT